jgi:hypothetical protein
MLRLIADDLPAPRPVPLSVRPLLGRHGHSSVDTPSRCIPHPPSHATCTSWPTVFSCHPSAQRVRARLRRGLAERSADHPAHRPLGMCVWCESRSFICRAERAHGDAGLQMATGQRRPATHGRRQRCRDAEAG